MTPHAVDPPAAGSLLQNVAEAAVQVLAPCAQLAGLSQAALALSARPAASLHAQSGCWTAPTPKSGAEHTFHQTETKL